MTLKFFSDTYALLKVDRFEGFVIRSKIYEFMINYTGTCKSRVTLTRTKTRRFLPLVTQKLLCLFIPNLYILCPTYTLPYIPNLTVIAPETLEIYALENHPVFFVFNKNSFHCRMTSLFYLLRCSVLLLRHNYLMPCTAVA